MHNKNLSKIISILYITLILYSCVSTSLDFWFYFENSLYSLSDFLQTFVISYELVAISDFAILLSSILGFFLEKDPIKCFYKILTFSFLGLYLIKIISFSVYYFCCDDIHNLFDETYKIYKNNNLIVEPAIMAWKISLVNGIISIFLLLFLIIGCLFLSYKINYEKINELEREITEKLELVEKENIN